MLQFIAACASSRVGLLNRRLKSVRAASVDTAGNFAVEISLIKYIGPFLTVESYTRTVENRRYRLYIPLARISEAISGYKLL